jgi:site-specific DNA recombinase
MRAVLYCRVSTADQVKNLSLPTQETACREYAEREGYDVAEVFVDRGESAKTTDRPEFQRMLAYCRKQKGHIHAVIVYALTRFSRNNADHHAIAALLRGQGVALRSVTEPIDDSPAGRFMEGILASMAQFDNDLRRDRTKVGMRAAVERGRWVWPAPVGYRTGIRARGEPSLVPHETHADWVRRAYEQLAHGHRTVSDVWRELHAAGVCARGSKPVSLQTIHDTLRNPAYFGRLRSRGLATDRSGDWLPLVSEETWHRAQLRLGRDGRGQPKKARNSDFPLVRFACCARCHSGLLGAWARGRSDRYAYYRCRKNCVNAPRHVVDAAFLDLLTRMKPDPAFLALLRRDLLLSWRDERDEVQRQRTSMEQEVAKLRAQLRRLEDAYIFEQAIDQPTYTARRDELRERQTLAELKLSGAVIDTLDVEGEIAAAEYAVTNGATLWTGTQSIERRIRLQWALLPDGVFFDGSQMSNRGTRWACYQLAGVGDGESRMVDLTGAGSNQIASWAEAWRAYLAAA